MTEAQTGPHGAFVAAKAPPDGLPALIRAKKARKMALPARFPLYTGPPDPLSLICERNHPTFSVGFVLFNPAWPRGRAGEGRDAEDMAEVKKMTQTQVVNEIATASGITKKQAKAAMEKLVELAIAQTKKVGVFVLPGIGRLKKVERKARMGRNPATGEPIKIPARKSVKLTLSKSIKDAIVPPKPKK